MENKEKIQINLAPGMERVEVVYREGVATRSSTMRSARSAVWLLTSQS